jgi:DNA-binding LytR/AlgR family response regulator
MKNMEAALPQAQFMRVHRSYIVALNQIKAITGNTIEVAGQQIPVSRELKESLVKRVF